MRIIPVSLFLLVVLAVIAFAVLPGHLPATDTPSFGALRALGAMSMTLAIVLLVITMRASAADKACALCVLSFGSFLVLLAVADGHQGLFVALPGPINTLAHVLLAVLPFAIAMAITNPHPTGQPSRRT